MYLGNIFKNKLKRKQNKNTSWLITTIKKTPKTPIQKLDKPIFSFKRTNEAASRNIKIISTFNGNLGTVLAAQNDSPLNYGSEHRDTAELSGLFYYH